MIIILAIDLLLLLVVAISFRSFTWGYFLSICWKIIIPYVARFQIGGISINANDILCIGLIGAYFVNRGKLNSRLSPKIRQLFGVYIVSTFILIILSSGVVPYSHQFQFFLKGFLLLEICYLILGFIALQNIKGIRFFYILLTLSSIAGVYGILVYFLKVNILVDTFSLIYAGSENQFSFFMEEIRGGLEGRTSGTFGHPLAWGQFWNILVPLVYLYRNRIGKYWFPVILIIGVTNMLLCGSRTALVSLFVFLLFVVITLSIKKKIKIGLACVIVYSIMFVQLGNNRQYKGIFEYVQSAVFFWDDFYSQKAAIGGSNTDMRQRQLEEAIRLMNTNPIAGIGLDYQYYSIDHHPNSILLGFESILFKKLVEQGLTGMLIFYYLIYLYYQFYRKRLRTKEENLIFLGYILSFMVSSHMTAIQGLNWLFFLLLPLLTLYSSRNQVKNYDTKNNSLLLAQR